MDADAANDKYSGVLEATLAPSRRTALLCGLAGSATLALLSRTPLPATVSLALAAFVVVVVLDAVQRVLAPHRISIDFAAVSVDGAAGSLRPGSFVAPWLAIVRWRPAGARLDRTLLVTPDRLPAAAFRHLRVIVKNTPV